MDNYDNNITEKQLKLSYWYLTHKDTLRRWVVAFLIVLNAGFLGYTAYGIVRHVIETADQQRMVALMAQDMVNYQEIRIKNQPRNLQISDVTVISTGEQVYDLVARVKNPNERWLVKSLEYQFILDSGVQEARTTFILPGEEKYFSDLALELTRAPRYPRLEFKDIKWQRILDYQNIKIEKLDFQVKNVQVVPASKADAGKTTFNITNNTAYDFWTIGLNIGLYQGKNLAGFSKTALVEFLSGQQRFVDMNWHERLSGGNKILVEPEVNIFDPSVFMELGGGKGELK